LGNLAIAYKDTKNYEQAKQTHLKFIELTQNLQGVDEQQKASILGTIYHNLGAVAQELREWEQASEATTSKLFRFTLNMAPAMSKPAPCTIWEG
jgi:tetratricopeptide (TPR) repeat protein